jgi:hypothetical protein
VRFPACRGLSTWTAHGMHHATCPGSFAAHCAVGADGDGVGVGSACAARGAHARPTSTMIVSAASVTARRHPDQWGAHAVIGRVVSVTMPA